MSTNKSLTREEIRDVFAEAFSAHWDPDELQNYADLRDKFAFHMADVRDDVIRLAGLYKSPESTEPRIVSELVYQFFLHAVPHLMAAGQIFDNVPDTFSEQTGVHFDSDTLETCVHTIWEIHQQLLTTPRDDDAVRTLENRLVVEQQDLTSFDSTFALGVQHDLAQLRRDAIESQPDELAAALREELAKMLEEEHWHTVLKFLRHHECEVAVALISYYRGRAYFELGYFEVAVEFLERAKDEDERFAPSLILPLLELGWVERAKSVARSAEESIVRIQPYEAFVLANGCSLLVEESCGEEERREWLERSIRVFELAIERAERANIQVLPGNQLALAICHRCLGSLERADAILRGTIDNYPEFTEARTLLASWTGASESISADDRDLIDADGRQISDRSIAAMDLSVLNQAA